MMLAPPAGLAAEGEGMVPDSGGTITLADVSDRQLVSLARKLVGNGRYRLGLTILNAFFERAQRNTELDWEAAVLREACLALAPTETPPSRAEKPPAPPPAAKPPQVKAVQVFTFTSPGLRDLPAEIAAIKARGFDTLIVRVFHNLGDRPLFKELPPVQSGVYFRTSEAPVAADVLPEIIRQAHVGGLRVFAWMTTRKNDWLIVSHPEWLEYQFDPGLSRNVPSRSLSLFQPEVRRKLRAVFRDLAAAGPDGILFQDDLIMRYNEGFSNLASQAFLLETGKGVHPEDLFVNPYAPERSVSYRPLFWQWSRWKAAAILSFLDELVREARGARPDLMVAANVYYESLLKPDSGLAWYAQDLVELQKHADFLALMSYHRQMQSELSLDDRQMSDVLSDFIKRAKGLAIDEARIIFKIQTTDWRNGQDIPESEWSSVRDKFLAAGSFSVAVLQH